MPDGTAAFGRATDLDGNRLLVGAVGEGSGAAYIFQEGADGWVETARLTPADPGPAQAFGGAVALDGDTALVGDTEVPPGGNPQSTPGPGSVYVFTRSEAGDWQERARITAPVPQDGARFGGSVALDGDTAVIGASGQDTTAGEDAGAAFVFTRSQDGSWALQAPLEAPAAAEGDRFGTAVALDGDTALIGSLLSDAATQDAGAAFTFTRSAGAWNSAATLTASDASPGDLFGDAVAVEGGQAIVGASGAGIAYTYDDATTAGTESAALEGDAALAGLESIAFSGSTLVIGDVGMGMAYVFVKAQGTWSQVDTLDAVDSAQDQYAWTVAVDGPTIAVGAPLHDSPAGRDAGAVYLYDACIETGPLTSAVHGSAEPAVADVAGQDTAHTLHQVNCGPVSYLENQA